MTLSLSLLFAVMLVGSATAVRKYDSYLSPVTVVGAAIALYVFAIPVEMNLVGTRLLYVGSSVAIVADPGLLPSIMISGIVAFTGFLLGYFALLNRRRVSLDPLAIGSSRFARHALMSAWLLGGVVTFFSFPETVMMVNDYESNVAMTYASPLYALLVRTTYTTYAMWVFVVTVPKSSLSVLYLVLPLIAWGVYSNDKDPLLAAAFCLVWTFKRQLLNRRSAIWFSLVLFAALMAGGLATVAFSQFRGGSTDVISFIEKAGLFRHAEPAGPMYSIVDSIRANAEGTPYLMGATVFHGLVLWIPRFVWPERPLDLAEQFARNHVPNWSPGEGYGFSPIAEGYLNGGLLGVLLLFVLIGFIFAILRNLLLSNDLAGDFRWLCIAMFYVPVMLIAFTVMRGPFSAIITNLFQTVVPFAFMAIATALVRSAGDVSEVKS